MVLENLIGQFLYNKQGRRRRQIRRDGHQQMKTSTVNDAPAVKAPNPTRGLGPPGLACIGRAGTGGCASGPRTNPDDPFESHNRSMTRFNDDVDAAILKPVPRRMWM